MDSLIRINTGWIFLGDVRVIKKVKLGPKSFPNEYQRLIAQIERGERNVDTESEICEQDVVLVQVGEEAYMRLEEIYSSFQLYKIRKMLSNKDKIKRQQNQDELYENLTILLDHTPTIPHEFQQFVDKETIRIYPNLERNEKISMKQFKKDKTYSKHRW